jgi:hypothetical protein
VSATLGMLAAQMINRMQAAGSSAAYRASKWQFYLDQFTPADYLFGRGKGFPNAVDGTYGLGVDSQYVRVLLEEGMIGLILMTAILWYMLAHIKKRGGEYQHAWAVVVAMLVMSVPLEAMQISKSGGFFWLIMFYLLMCQRRPTGGATPEVA